MRPRLDELLILVLVMVAIGTQIVPCHWTAVWFDTEFTGWVTPIANRLASGMRLYGDGGHLPIPPLSFLASYALFGGDGIWISESALNFAGVSLAILLVYLGLAVFVAPPTPFIAALATCPVFFALGKTIAYDGVAQACAAAVIASAAAAAWRPRSDGDPRTAATRDRWPLLLLAASTTACLLAKQSTGIGAALGAGVALVVVAANRRLLERIGRAAQYTAWTILMLGISVLVMSPWVDPHGLVMDIFLTGAEPKLGTTRMVENLTSVYVSQTMAFVTPARLAATIIIAAFAFRGRDSDALPAEGTATVDTWSPRISSWPATVAALLGAAAGFALVIANPSKRPAVFLGPGMISDRPSLFTIGLLLGLIVAAAAIGRGFGLRRRTTSAAPSHWDRSVAALGVMTIVALAAAAFHSLSSGTFRWTYDTNPLVTVVLAVFAFMLIRAGGAVTRTRRWATHTFAACVAFGFTFATWTNFHDVLQRVRTCTEPWPEVAALDGAYMPKHAARMRELVQQVRALAPDPNDTVLMLPEDPDAASWFDRPRPALAGGLIFWDQYWDRYVDEDFDRLSAAPPKVLVIGPFQWTKAMGKLEGSRGMSRLINRVERELESRYENPIMFVVYAGGKIDFMRILVRRGTE